jgi:hypothetical protein
MIAGFRCNEHHREPYLQLGSSFAATTQTVGHVGITLPRIILPSSQLGFDPKSPCTSSSDGGSTNLRKAIDDGETVTTRSSTLSDGKETRGGDISKEPVDSRSC